MNLGFDYRTLRWLKRGPRRRTILDYLATVNHPATATQIAKALNLPLNRTSDTLRELRLKNLVRVLNPNAPYHRLCALTSHGLSQAAKLPQHRPRTKHF